MKLNVQVNAQNKLVVTDAATGQPLDGVDGVEVYFDDQVKRTVIALTCTADTTLHVTSTPPAPPATPDPKPATPA